MHAIFQARVLEWVAIVFSERERYTHLNAGLKKIAWRNKDFFNEQYKEIEENNRESKTRELFKKIGNIRGAFHSKVGTIKDRNSKDLIEALEIKQS